MRDTRAGSIDREHSGRQPYPPSSVEGGPSNPQSHLHSSYGYSNHPPPPHSAYSSHDPSRYPPSYGPPSDRRYLGERPDGPRDGVYRYPYEGPPPPHDPPPPYPHSHSTGPTSSAPYPSTSYPSSRLDPSAPPPRPPPPPPPPPASQPGTYGPPPSYDCQSRRVSDADRYHPPQTMSYVPASSPPRPPHSQPNMTIGQAGPRPRTHSYNEASPPHPYSQPGGTRHGHPVPAPAPYSPYRSSQNPYPDSREYEADRRWDTANEATHPPRGQYSQNDPRPPSVPAPAPHGSHLPATPATQKSTNVEYGSSPHYPPQDHNAPPLRETRAPPPSSADATTGASIVAVQRNQSTGSVTSDVTNEPSSLEQAQTDAGVGPATETCSNQREEVTNMGCTCKKSKCLKLYCQCFAASVTCGQNCRCLVCHNTPNHEAARKAAIRGILQRNPQAFETKFKATNNATSSAKTVKANAGRGSLAHKSGCKCRKSACLKKYCECYHAGVKCNVNCRCVGCQNMPKGGFDPRGKESGNFPLTAQSFAADVYSVKHGYDYNNNKYDEHQPPGVFSSSSTTATKKKEEPWMMDAAQNLTFLKNAAPHPNQREKNSSNGNLQHTQDTPNLLEDTSSAYGDSKATEYTKSDTGISPGTEKSASKAVNALLMAAYAMTEFANAGSSSGAASPPTTPQTQDITFQREQHTETETAVKYQPSPPKRKTESTTFGNEDHNGSPTKSRRQLVYNRDITATTQTTTAPSTTSTSISTTTTRPKITGTVLVGNRRQALNGTLMKAQSEPVLKSVVNTIRGGTSKTTMKATTTTTDHSSSVLNGSSLLKKNDIVLKSKETAVVKHMEHPLLDDNTKNSSSTVATSPSSTTTSTNTTTTAPTPTKVGIVTPVTARCIAFEQLAMTTNESSRRQLGIDFQEDDEGDNDRNTTSSPDDTNEKMELVATS